MDEVSDYTLYKAELLPSATVKRRTIIYVIIGTGETNTLHECFIVTFDLVKNTELRFLLNFMEV